MKLAEALIQRADAQKRLAQIQSRAVAVARHQEDEVPAEDASALLIAGRALTDEIEGLIRQINRTNSVNEIAPGVTITDAIAERDALAMRRKLVTAVADAGSGDGGHQWARQLRSELRYVSAVPVADLRREADDLARRFRELDSQLQAANWAVELIDG